MADARRAPLLKTRPTSPARARLLSKRVSMTTSHTALLEGASGHAQIGGRDVGGEVITVPGALEIAPAIAIALDAAKAQLKTI